MINFFNDFSAYMEVEGHKIFMCKSMLIRYIILYIKRYLFLGGGENTEGERVS